MRKIIFLAEYGIFPDTGIDCSDELQKIFNSIDYDNENSIAIRFKKGTYHILKPIYISKAKNLDIYGSNSTIIAHFDPSAPISENNDVFFFDFCDDVSICDLFFDTDNPIGAAGYITSIDRENGTADLKIYDEFPVTGFEHFAATNSFDENGSPDYALATYNADFSEEKITLPDGTEKTRLVGLDYDVMGEQLVRMKLDNISPNLIIGHKINIRYEIYGHSIFNFASCCRVTLKNITIYSATSFGVKVSPRSRDFTFDNFCICVPKCSKRLKAANADGLHLLGLAGKLVLKNCNIEGLGDDPLNIHGIAGGVYRFDNEKNTISMVYPFRNEIKPLPEKWAAPGDTIYVYDSKTFLKKGSFIIDELDEENNAIFRDKNGEIEVGDTLANAEYFTSVHIDGCTFRNTRARGLLIQTNNVLIENSYIYGMSLAAMLFAPDIRVWWEVGPCQNVEIRNNIIEHCAHIESEANQGAIIFKACHDGCSDEYPAGVHENIYIHDNKFINIPTSAIFVSSAKNVRVENNFFRNCASKASHEIVVLNCTDVLIENNVNARVSKISCANN